MRETRSSTARALAMYDIPGLDTVHCWSNVRSLVDCFHKITSKTESLLIKYSKSYFKTKKDYSLGKKHLQNINDLSI